MLAYLSRNGGQVTRILDGLDKVPLTIDMSLNKAKYKIMNHAQVVVSKGK